MKSFAERVAEVLVREGLLLEAQLEEARKIHEAEGGKLLDILTRKDFVNDLDMTITMGQCLDVPPLNLSRVQPDEEITSLVPRDLCEKHKIFPVAKIGKRLFVAMADPLNVLALDDLRHRTKLEISPMITTAKAVEDALSKVSGGGAAMDEVMKEAIDAAAAEDIETTPQKTDQVDLDKMSAQSDDAPVIKIVNLILVQALKEKASDIHIEPFEKTLKLRYRVDGALIEASSPPKSLQLPIASRIKILAGLDIAERRLPQDGRFRIRVSGKEVDLRVSILPTVFGEKIVIRILDKGALGTSIEQLGMDEGTLKVFRNAINAPHGMILVTGPTGSGKTTTLYTVLTELNDPRYNIVTVEDPVEYQLNGVNQVAVRSEIGLDFASSLRSILRQDPDIVMVGEIRDNETADIAVKAALTGHQVLSTLHTNDAAGAISRLDDMGIEPFLIASSLLMTCAQRLVRRICPNCKDPVQIDPEVFERLGLEGDYTTQTYYMGSGCERCKQRGYSGRAAIIEALGVTESIRRLIIKRASANIIKNQAISEGMTTLRMAGINKAIEGVTSLEEVWQVTTEET